MGSEIASNLNVSWAFWLWSISRNTRLWYSYWFSGDEIFGTTPSLLGLAPALIDPGDQATQLVANLALVFNKDWEGCLLRGTLAGVSCKILQGPAGQSPVEWLCSWCGRTPVTVSSSCAPSVPFCKQMGWSLQSPFFSSLFPFLFMKWVLTISAAKSAGQPHHQNSL